MRTIYKYEAEVEGLTDVSLPAGADIIKIDADPTGSTLLVWAIVDNEVKERDLHEFAIVSTGHPLSQHLTGDAHLTTIITAGGALVWHVFAVGVGPVAI